MSVVDPSCIWPVFSPSRPSTPILRRSITYGRHSTGKWPVSLTVGYLARGCTIVPLMGSLIELVNTQDAFLRRRVPPVCPLGYTSLRVLYIGPRSICGCSSLPLHHWRTLCVSRHSLDERRVGYRYLACCYSLQVSPVLTYCLCTSSSVCAICVIWDSCVWNCAFISWL